MASYADLLIVQAHDKMSECIPDPRFFDNDGLTEWEDQKKPPTDPAITQGGTSERQNATQRTIRHDQATGNDDISDISTSPSSMGTGSSIDIPQNALQGRGILPQPAGYNPFLLHHRHGRNETFVQSVNPNPYIHPAHESMLDPGSAMNSSTLDPEELEYSGMPILVLTPEDAIIDAEQFSKGDYFRQNSKHLHLLAEYDKNMGKFPPGFKFGFGDLTTTQAINLLGRAIQRRRKQIHDERTGVVSVRC
jgi:hypothetical protein